MNLLAPLIGRLQKAYYIPFKSLSNCYPRFTKQVILWWLSSVICEILPVLEMKFGLFSIRWFNIHPKEDLRENLESEAAIMEQSKQKTGFDIKLWGWSLVSVVPWAGNTRDNIRGPTTINRGLKKRARIHGLSEPSFGSPVRFRPYVSKVPWHKGARAFLSQLFPRYGHYCGPNWSSGKDNGSLIWDRRPIDWLDYCCYCHDIGYDTHDQAELLKADLEFLECLERPHMNTIGDARAAHIYRTMCITGLKNFLIPYRTHLVKLHSGHPLFDFRWLSNVKWRRINMQET